MTRKNTERRISIRSVRRNPPDLGKLGRALIALAIAQTEAEAQAEDAKAKKASLETDASHPEQSS